MSENYERLRKWAQDAAGGKTDKIPYIDITDLISEVMKLRATAPVAEPVTLSDEEILAISARIWENIKGDDEYDRADINFARAILAASQGASHG